jgi:hypothetical protein
MAAPLAGVTESTVSVYVVAGGGVVFPPPLDEPPPPPQAESSRIRLVATERVAEYANFIEVLPSYAASVRASLQGRKKDATGAILDLPTILRRLKRS